MVEAHLQDDPLGDLHLQPVRLAEAQTVDQEGVRLVECGRGEHRVAEPDATCVEASWHKRREERSGNGGEPGGDLDVGAPRRGHPGESLDPPRRQQRVVDDLDRRVAGSGEAGDHGIEHRCVGSLESDERCVVGLARRHDHTLRPLVVAPREGAVRGRLPGHEPDHVAEERRQARRVGHFDTQVADLESLVHLFVPLFLSDDIIPLIPLTPPPARPRSAPRGARTRC